MICTAWHPRVKRPISGLITNWKFSTPQNPFISDPSLRLFAKGQIQPHSGVHSFHSPPCLMLWDVNFTQNKISKLTYSLSVFGFTNKETMPAMKNNEYDWQRNNTTISPLQPFLTYNSWKVFPAFSFVFVFSFCTYMFVFMISIFKGIIKKRILLSGGARGHAF